ncbi:MULTISPECIES: hypothetical protein [Lysinibacillus]|uniref:hypothetical protein n=1 Tax=Lysinibacillus TaxID=400634 RepID=UPI00257FDD94|nr:MULTISPECIES: hypothetical protein [Lysinibacillus]
MNQSSNITHSDKRQWLEKVHKQRRERSISIGMETIDMLVNQSIPVTYHNISEYSKLLDQTCKGIHPNTNVMRIYIFITKNIVRPIK